jgi:hypothetical protein
MNRYNVIHMAHKVMPEIAREITDEELEGFAKLIAAAEREYIAREIERRAMPDGDIKIWFTEPLMDCAAALRASCEEIKRHPGYIVGDHWLQTAYSRICAGDDEAEVLADYGYKREKA